MAAYSGKLHAAPGPVTAHVLQPVPALAVVPLPSMLEELGAANPKTLYAFIGRVWPQGRSLLGRD